MFIEEVQSDWRQAGREKGYESQYRAYPGKTFFLNLQMKNSALEGEKLAEAWAAYS